MLREASARRRSGERRDARREVPPGVDGGVPAKYTDGAVRVHAEGEDGGGGRRADGGEATVPNAEGDASGVGAGAQERNGPPGHQCERIYTSVCVLASDPEGCLRPICVDVSGCACVILTNTSLF